MTEDTIIRDALTLATLPPDTPVQIGSSGYHRHARCMMELISDYNSGYVRTVRAQFDQEGARVVEPRSTGRCTWCGALFREVGDGRE